MVENRISSWCMSFPGLIRSSSPRAVLMEAMALFVKQTGTEVGLAVFTDHLWRLGFRPEQVGVHWELALPEKPLSDDSHYRALRHITR